ncbi:MAG TPA: PQQ-dependent sugar dehydrogenase [Thermoanaerobaculia bacterium]|nr:PQQ-dependent sugar dehydrogenase [Thermoanaerobaculia bacterium]
MIRTRLLFGLLLFAAALHAQMANLAIKQLASLPGSPTAITNAGDLRIFITLQQGQVMIWNGTSILPTPFLDVRNRVSCCGERGLLSIAFHPQFKTNGYFFADYTDVQGNTVVSRFSVMPSDPNRADAASELKILQIAQPYPNHNGGQLQFGPDGFLYIGMGDGGSGGDPENRAQDLSTMLGKILRIDVDHGSPYSVPFSNPYAGHPGARGEIWAYGLRNPWRFSFDRVTGDLWIGDVGQNLYEEVDLQPFSSTGGENYGWRRMEGLHCYNPPSNCNNGGITLPIIEYTHDDKNCSITGGYRYRGAVSALMYGLYFYADYCTGRIWAASAQSDGTWKATELLHTSVQITTFGEDVNGELYLGGGNGVFYALIDHVPARRRAVR